MKRIKEKTSERINLYMDLKFYNELKKKADESYLKIATYTRQLLKQAMKNNTIKN